MTVNDAKTCCESGRAGPQEPDAATFSNLGDAGLTWSQLLADAGHLAAAREVTGAALAAYQRACELSDSHNGALTWGGGEAQRCPPPSPPQGVYAG
jgi:hypothetical protein